MKRKWRSEWMECRQQIPPVFLLLLLQAVCVERALHDPAVPYSAARLYAWSFADCLAAFLLWMRYTSHRRAATVQAQHGYALPYGQAAAPAANMGRVTLPPSPPSPLFED